MVFLVLRQFCWILSDMFIHAKEIIKGKFTSEFSFSAMKHIDISPLSQKLKGQYGLSLLRKGLAP